MYFRDQDGACKGPSPHVCNTFPITWLPESRWQSPTFPWVTLWGEGECLLCPALLQSLSSPLLRSSLDSASRSCSSRTILCDEWPWWRDLCFWGCASWLPPWRQVSCSASSSIWRRGRCFSLSCLVGFLLPHASSASPRSDSRSRLRGLRAFSLPAALLSRSSLLLLQSQAPRSASLSRSRLGCLPDLPWLADFHSCWWPLPASLSRGELRRSSEVERPCSEAPWDKGKGASRWSLRRRVCLSPPPALRGSEPCSRGSPQGCSEQQGDKQRAG